MSNFEKLKRSVIKEELVVLTGNSDKAVILNQFIYWSERVKDFDKFINEELGRINNLNDANSLSEQLEEIGNTFKQYGWIYKTCEELLDEVMLSISPKTVRRHIIDLVNNGWLEERKNPKYKWDRTLQYRVNLTKIQNDLYNLGYYLADYKVKMPFLELSQKEYKQGTNDTSRTDNLSFQKNDLTFQSDSNVRAIPEITTENTINNNNIYCSSDDELPEEEEKILPYEQFFNECWKLYPDKSGKSKISNSKKKEIYKLGDEFKRCISRYLKHVEYKRNNGFKELKYKNGSTFFNRDYKDYLDENYKDTMGDCKDIAEDNPVKEKKITELTFIEYASIDDIPPPEGMYGCVRPEDREGRTRPVQPPKIWKKKL